MNGYFKILVRNFLSVLYMDYISGTFLSILYMDYIVESSSIYSPDKHFIEVFTPQKSANTTNPVAKHLLRYSYLVAIPSLGEQAIASAYIDLTLTTVTMFPTNKQNGPLSCGHSPVIQQEDTCDGEAVGVGRGSSCNQLQLKYLLHIFTNKVT